MDLFLFGIFFVTCGAAGATGAMFPPGPWYETLKKPSWVPPNWVFPVVWSSIYILISFAGARAAALDGSGLALAFWAMQAGFSTLWTPVFFGLRRFRAAVVVIVILWLSVFGATLTHFQLDLWAGLAFVPYLIWVSVAGALNVAMVRLNPDVEAVQPGH
ncbi:MAG: tryptophan-rich sensory protein [Silicimonas sp.]|nr:tryptophan-rich sensory protein [Silicimonas sp.]